VGYVWISLADSMTSVSRIMVERKSLMFRVIEHNIGAGEIVYGLERNASHFTLFSCERGYW
jgi:hypothetical protein